VRIPPGRRVHGADETISSFAGKPKRFLLVLAMGLSRKGQTGECPMCDYSLHNVRSRPAAVGDKLITRDFGTGTRGFSGV
jgi:hypothetical protein